LANAASHSGIRHKKPTRATQNEPALVEQVRSRAYELYEFRGKEDGHDPRTGYWPKNKSYIGQENRATSAVRTPEPPSTVFG
jgi:hypothetical protein